MVRSWIRTFFARTTRSRLRPRLEILEERLAPAIQLSYGGPGTSLSLVELVSGATPSVGISEPTPGQLRIDLGGKEFAATSTATAVGLTYENSGVPHTSHYATVNIGQTNSITALQATLAGDALTIGTIVNASGGLGNVTASADILAVNGLDTSAANGNVDLKATTALTIGDQALLATGTGTIALAAGVKPDGTGNSDGVPSGTLPTVQDFGFEQPVVGSGSNAYQLDPAGMPWTYSGGSQDGSGVSGNGSPFTFYNLNAPQGNQVAVLPNQNTISQTINFAAGTYRISFLAAQMAHASGSSNQTFQVEIDGSAVGSFRPGETYYVSYSTETFAVTAGSHTVAFVGTNLNNDSNVAFLDAVSITGDVAASGMLTIAAGATVVSDNANGSAITLRGADVNIDTSGAPVVVGGHPFSRGGGPTSSLTGFNTPSALAFDSNGNLYVADTFANTVSKFAPGETTPLFTITGLNTPNALAVDVNNNLYVANYGPGGSGTTVSVYTPDGQAATSFTGLSGPSALAFDGGGNLYIANTVGNTVTVIASNNSVTTLNDIHLQGPSALAFDANGNLYVGNSMGGTVSVFAPNSTTSSRTIAVTPFAGGGPNALGFDGDGNLYVAHDNAVSVFAPNSPTPFRILSGLNGPAALAFDTPHGNLFVANSGDNTVSVFAPGSLVPTATLTGLIQPLALTFDANGSLFVPNNNSVSVFALNPTAGGVRIRTAQPGQAISLGFEPQAGLSLSNAELARIFSATTGTITFGDSTYTGTITFAATTVASVPGSSVVVLQSPTGAGSIVLDSFAEHAALDAGSGNIQLTAGTGGIIATGWNATASLVSSRQINLDTAGGIGSGGSRVLFDPTTLPAAVVIGATLVPASGVYLGGLGALILGNVQTADAPLDVTATANLKVAPGMLLTTGTGTIALAAGVSPNGGSSSGGVLQIASGATVVSDNTGGSAISLSGTDIDIDTGSNPAIVGAHRSSVISTTPSATFTGLNQPPAVIVGADGTLYVANGTTVSVFAPGSTTFTTLTGLDFPRALAIGPDGNLYVANTGSSAGPPGTTVSVFKPNTTTPDHVLTGLNGPGDLAFDAAGNLYVANTQGTTVSVFAPDGTPLPALTGLSLPSALGFDFEGRLFVANGDSTVRVFNPGSTTTDSTITGLMAPVDLALDAVGNLYVANAAANTVSRFDRNGNLTNTYAGLNVPIALAVDDVGNLYVANIDGNTVSVFAPDGMLTTLAGTAAAPLNAPGALAFDAAGNLYVANSQGTTVSVFAAAPPIPAAGGVVLRAAQSGQPINVGIVSGTGLSLSNAELARIFTTTSGIVTFGDSFQTGAITFTAASPATTPGASVAAIQSITGQGSIVLNNSSGTALVVGPGNIQLSAGTGGMVASGGAATSYLASTGQVSLDTAGGIGTSTGRLLFDAAATPAAVVIGKTTAPQSGVFLSGLGNLALADVSTTNASLDVTAVANLTVIRNALVATGMGTIALTAGINADGTASNGHGVLTIASGATVVSDSAGTNAITLRGTDLDIDSSAAPAVIGAHRSAVSSTATSTLTGLSGPSALVIDKPGNLYVANAAGNSVTVFAPDGSSTTLTGTAAAPLNGPSALALDADGNLYVANAAGNTVSRYAPGGTVTALTGLNGPSALALDNAGNLYVANAAGNTVSIFAADGTPRTPLAGLSGPNALAFDARGNLFVANAVSNTVSVFAPNGTTPLTTLSGLNNPRALAFDARGNLYVANFTGNTVSVFGLSYDPQGNLLPPNVISRSPLTGLSGPRALVFDTRGNLFVANAGTGGTGTTVSVFAPSSTTPTATLSGLHGPSTLAVDAVGNLYVANSGNGTVNVFAPRPAAGEVVIRTVQPDQAISVGPASGTGLSLSNAELGQIFTAAAGSLTIGAPTHTGTITFAASTPSATPGANVVVIQSPTGPGVIVLDSTTGIALDAGPSTVRLRAGNGGIVAMGGSANASIASTGQVSLDTAGGIGTTAKRILFDATHTPVSVSVGGNTAPGANVYLGGHGSLTLANVQTANAIFDVTAVANLNVARTAQIATGAGTISLAAGANPDGSGSTNGGVLTIATGATVASDNTGSNAITLRGTDLDLDTSVVPAVVGAQRDGLSTTPTSTLAGLTNPGPLIFGPDGNLYVINGNSVSVFGPNGNLTTTYTGLDQPSDLAFDTHGNLFVVNAGSADSPGTTVSVFGKDGAPQAPLTGLNTPFALAFDADGNLFVSNFGDSTVRKFTLAYDTHGNLLPSSTTPSATLNGLTLPGAMAFDSRGNLFVSDLASNSVGRFDPNGTLTATLTGLSSPFALAFDAYDNLFVTNDVANSVSVFAPGSTTPTATLTGLNSPRPLIFDATGHLFVGNTGKSFTGTSVSVFALAYDAHGNLLPNGAMLSATLTGTFSTPLEGAAALAVDAHGNLYVANITGSTVSIFAGSAPRPTAGGVVVRPSQLDQPISLGATSGPGLALSDDELARIFTTTTGFVTIGGPTYSGDINVAGNVTSHSGYRTLSLQTTKGTINTVNGATLAVANLALQAGSGIGTTGPLAMDAAQLLFANQSGSIHLNDVRGVTLIGFENLLASSIPGDIFSSQKVGDVYTLLQSNGGVSGEISYQGQTLAEGATLVLADGNHYQLSYKANGGKDVTLTRLANPITPGPDLPTSPEPEARPPLPPVPLFVQALYRTVLGREAEQAGLNYWLAFLQAGGTRQQVADGFWNSVEHRGLQVDQFYASYLHRTAEAAGRTFWINALLGGATEAAVMRGFLASNEYRQAHATLADYVLGLYADVLGRTPEPAGLDYWHAAAQGGLSAEAIADGFLTAQEEHEQTLDRYYADYLGRGPDAQGRAVWLAVLQGGYLSPGQVAAAFLASDEFFARAAASVS